MGRHSPSFIAPTGSCARPKSSHHLKPQPRSMGLCRLPTRPCWMSALPDVISVNPSQRARPLTPVDSHGALARFFPWQHRPSHSSRWSAFPRLSIQQLQYGGMFSGSQAFLYVLARCFARHPGCSHSRLSSRAAMTSTSRHAPDGYPVQVPDMLAVRPGQLTAPGLSPC